MDATCHAVARYIGARLRLSRQAQVEFVNDIAWQERFRQLDTGHIQIAWICGSHYVRRIDKMRVGKTATNIELLAAPVWQGERYQADPFISPTLSCIRPAPSTPLPICTRQPGSIMNQVRSLVTRPCAII